jgi:nucleoside-diphosphate-sugar epimerase
VNERHPVNPPDVNAVGKLCGEQLVGIYQRLHGVRSVIVRLTNTYGPRMRIRDARQMFVGIWIRNLLERKPLVVFGDGLQRRDFIHVDDVVDALLLATDSALTGRCFNIGSEESISLRSLAELLCSYEPGGPGFEIRPFPDERKAIDIGDYVGDSREFQRAASWRTRVSLEDGMRTTVDFYRMNLSQYVESR